MDGRRALGVLARAVITAAETVVKSAHSKSTTVRSAQKASQASWVAAIKSLRIL